MESKAVHKNEEGNQQRKKSKRLSKVKPAQNMSKNPQSFLEISPVQKEVLSSRNLRDHTTYE